MRGFPTQAQTPPVRGLGRSFAGFGWMLRSGVMRLAVRVVYW